MTLNFEIMHAKLLMALVTSRRVRGGGGGAATAEEAASASASERAAAGSRMWASCYSATETGASTAPAAIGVRHRAHAAIGVRHRAHASRWRAAALAQPRQKAWPHASCTGTRSVRWQMLQSSALTAASTCRSAASARALICGGRGERFPA